MQSVNEYMILIVDDQIINIKLLSAILEKDHYRTEYAINGRDALDKAKSLNPCLILLDIEMPDMSGFDVCRLLQEDPETNDIPVIFLTSKSNQEDIIKGFEYGGVDYITRPFNKNEVKARIKTHLELKKSKEYIKDSVKELQQLNAEKDKLFSIISHDIRSVFSSMHGFIDILYHQCDFKDTEHLQYLVSKAFDSSNRLNNLLNDLLQWSRFQMKNYQMEKKTFIFIDLLNDVINTYYDHLDNKGLKIQIDIAEDLSLYADFNMIKTLMRNLISNAIKFSFRNGIISITAEKKETEYVISVQDYGAGIPPEKQKNLFKLDKVYSTKGTEKEIGTGLGLILCKELVSKHDGKIAFESEVNKGTRFYFSIPFETQ
ncbi:MAG TPA: hybrid sensor histidine kinase/response regulator [Candidatus Cloacimonadota bacterium]|nr:hybrid sensor histidine kinase/response regulator [Candidatus Cloacimonadota bacterium]